MKGARIESAEGRSRELRDLFEANLVREIGSELSRVDAAFDVTGFLASALDGLTNLQVTARAWHLADTLRLACRRKDAGCPGAGIEFSL